MTLSFFRILVTVITSVFVMAVYPSGALADETARISRLESEIQLLRTQIAAQDRRIQRLEEEWDRRASGQPIPGIPKVRDDRAMTVATGPLPWHSLEPWELVKKGMSETEVKSVLGEPTYSESIDSFKTLFYNGLVKGSGTLSGHVNLRDGRVVAINKPGFEK